MRWWSWMWFKQGQIEVECGDESDCDGGECGDGCGAGNAKKINFAGYLSTTKPIALHPIPNQSKPIVPTLSHSLL